MRLALSSSLNKSTVLSFDNAVFVQGVQHLTFMSIPSFASMHEDIIKKFRAFSVRTVVTKHEVSLNKFEKSMRTPGVSSLDLKKWVQVYRE
ncbi:hypothetical protein Tco_0013273 [Tanacetum coccineum]